jgi:ribosomal protein S18 acetylase RimI-like enzyme
MIVIKYISPDDWMQWREMRLSALGDAPYAFSSLLRDWQDEGEQRWRNRLAEVSVNVIANLHGRDAGMVSGMSFDQEVELLSMWVAPFARGLGVGDELVNTIIQWTFSQEKPRLILRVQTGNDRAAALYVRHGFEYPSPSEGDADAHEARERLMVRTQT